MFSRVFGILPFALLAIAGNTTPARQCNTRYITCCQQTLSLYVPKHVNNTDPRS
ncbi:hypothetical protein BS17DRAFT_786421 [Gyrodon lividus]|nr:hypothetical protein BS17DRAFT_786421 [Gyrodon lividus]